MIFDKMRQEWKPEHIIPFQVTKEDCKKAYCKEVRRHPFVSRKYSNPDLIESFRGIYMPYWSYRAVMQGQFSVRATSPRERISSDTYEIIHYDLVGNSNLAMEGYSRDASLSFDDDISESLAPYEYKEQKPFVPGYLSGFYAETGNVDPHEYDSVVALEMKEDSVNVLEQDKQLQEQSSYCTGICHDCGSFIRSLCHTAGRSAGLFFCRLNGRRWSLRALRPCGCRCTAIRSKPCSRS